MIKITTKIQGLAFIAVIFALLFANSSLASSESSKTGTLVNQQSYELSEAVKPSISNNEISKTDIVIGNKDAKVLFIEYFAPTCTHCRKYHLKIYPELKAKYIDTGKIAYVMRELVGNKQDFDASLIARCKGDKDSYLKLTEQLLLNQEAWAFSDWVFSKKYKENLFAIADEYGITKDQYNKCLNDEEKLNVVLLYAAKTFLDKDFIGTPSFYIDGQVYKGEYTTKAISVAIDAMLLREKLVAKVRDLNASVKKIGTKYAK